MTGESLITEEYWDVIAHEVDGKVRGYKCPEWFDGCDFEFDADREQVMDHRETHHNITPDGVMTKFVCSVCARPFVRRSECAEHVCNEHPAHLDDSTPTYEDDRNQGPFGRDEDGKGDTSRSDDESAESETWEPWEER